MTFFSFFRIYQPQPLLLHPPLPPRPPVSNNAFRCHSRSPFAPASIDNGASLNPYTRLMREYFWFLTIGCCAVLLILNHRRILDCLSFRNATRQLRECRRCLCGRKVAVTQSSVEQDGEFLFLRPTGEAFREPVIETVRTSLPRRFVSQFWTRRPPQNNQH